MFLFSISWESEPGLGELDVVGRNGGQGGALLLEEITWGNNLNIIIIVVIVIAFGIARLQLHITYVIGL